MGCLLWLWRLAGRAQSHAERGIDVLVSVPPVGGP